MERLKITKAVVQKLKNCCNNYTDYVNGLHKFIFTSSKTQEIMQVLIFTPPEGTNLTIKLTDKVYIVKTSETHSPRFTLPFTQHPFKELKYILLIDGVYQFDRSDIRSYHILNLLDYDESDALIKTNNLIKYFKRI